MVQLVFYQLCTCFEVPASFLLVDEMHRYETATRFDCLYGSVAQAENAYKLVILSMVWFSLWQFRILVDPLLNFAMDANQQRQANYNYYSPAQQVPQVLRSNPWSQQYSDSQGYKGGYNQRGDTGASSSGNSNNNNGNYNNNNNGNYGNADYTNEYNGNEGEEYTREYKGALYSGGGYSRIPTLITVNPEAINNGGGNNANGNNGYNGYGGLNENDNYFGGYNDDYRGGGYRENYYSLGSYNDYSYNNNDGGYGNDGYSGDSYGEGSGSGYRGSAYGGRRRK
uniref:Uncharacterized protein n=1 Tax=Plectus sambesii TaxID=2011161 RepID=A0A914WD41_9BILA